MAMVVKDLGNHHCVVLNKSASNKPSLGGVNDIGEDLLESRGQDSRQKLAVTVEKRYGAPVLEVLLLALILEEECDHGELAGIRKRGCTIQDGSEQSGQYWSDLFGEGLVELPGETIATRRGVTRG